MTKLSRKSLNPDDLGLYINNLWSAFTLANSKDDIRLLFKDLFTHTEYKMFAKRFEIARRLLAEQTYDLISSELNVTAHTIAGVSNILANEGEGLRRAHKSLLKIEAEIQKKKEKRTENLENPFLKKTHRKTVLGQALKAGALQLDKYLAKRSKRKTAYNKIKL
jgi:uncharacterized protein YerC